MGNHRLKKEEFFTKEEYERYSALTSGDFNIENHIIAYDMVRKIWSEKIDRAFIQSFRLVHSFGEYTET